MVKLALRPANIGRVLLGTPISNLIFYFLKDPDKFQTGPRSRLLPARVMHLSMGTGCRRWGSRQNERSRTAMTLKGEEVPSRIDTALSESLRR